MRLFTGIELPPEIRERLERLIDGLRPTAHLSWSPAYNLHITIKFIGEWPQERLAELTPVLAGLCARPPLTIQVTGLGWLPNPHRPHVFWAGIEGGEALRELASATEDALEPLGIAREQRAFRPHLTLARIRNPVPLTTLREAISHLESMNFGEFQCPNFHLYLSKPGSAGSVYTKLGTYQFGKS